jgi:parallel beta-helix repeat protein
LPAHSKKLMLEHCMNAFLQISPATSVGMATLWIAANAFAAQNQLPVVRVTTDDVVLTNSCLVEIPPGAVISDPNHNGVLHVAADGIAIRFAPGSVLRGAPADRPWSELQGVGIRIDGRSDVSLVGAQVHGFKCGVWASRANRLTITGGDFSDNFRQRLRSTPAAEDGGDWLFPHHNDDRKWRDEYGAAIAVENSVDLTANEVRVRRGQNGILLDRVNGGRIYDNDCSFLSGWGLAMWRSSRNLVSRNAFDFCVRGHVEGVYNRGQDSAGILCFEQCNDNLFLENSATHGGDGFFGFAGRDALGEAWLEREREKIRRETGREDVEALIRIPPDVAARHGELGCNNNVFIGNDFSYAAAHGLELTFSRGNRILGNRLVENAICGIWGGYSSDTQIVSNRFEGNGGMAYGLERGGVNMEHASGNLIVGNQFLNNRCAVHLWWDEDAGLLRMPGVSARNRRVSNNWIVANDFIIDPRHPFGTLRPEEELVILQLRDVSHQHVTNNFYFDNRVRLDLPRARELLLDPGCEPTASGQTPAIDSPEFHPVGRHRPVGARANLRGRHRIVLDEWGPWDHESPLIRPGRQDATGMAYDLFGFDPAMELEVRVLAGDVQTEVHHGDSHHRLRVFAPPGIHPFQIQAGSGNTRRELAGTLVNARWQATFFNWSMDPREDLDAWRKLAQGPEAWTAEIDRLDLSYGWDGPGRLNLKGPPNAMPGTDHFGMVAQTQFQIPAGRWRVRTLSDDGVRVLLNGKVILENWTWHGPTRDTAVFEQSRSDLVQLVVEHFEIDGYAVLQLEIDPAP